MRGGAVDRSCASTASERQESKRPARFDPADKQRLLFRLLRGAFGISLRDCDRRAEQVCLVSPDRPGFLLFLHGIPSPSRSLDTWLAVCIDVAPGASEIKERHDAEDRKGHKWKDLLQL